MGNFGNLAGFIRICRGPTIGLSSGTEIVGLGRGSNDEARLEDYIVSGLVDFDDVAYDSHADLLYDLAAQTVKHFASYLSAEDTGKVLRLHQREIARFIHVQMQQHYWESAMDYEVVVLRGRCQQGFHGTETDRLRAVRADERLSRVAGG